MNPTNKLNEALLRVAQARAEKEAETYASELSTLLTKLKLPYMKFDQSVGNAAWLLQGGAIASKLGDSNDEVLVGNEKNPMGLHLPDLVKVAKAAYYNLRVEQIHAGEVARVMSLAGVEMPAEPRK